MQRVNDDMDELYRKAAENYPLNTDTTDWEKLRKKLDENSDEKPGIAGDKKNYKAFLLLLLLIPAGLIGYKYFSGNSNNNPGKQVVSTSQGSNKISQISSDNTATVNKVNTENATVPVSENKDNANVQQTTQRGQRAVSKGSPRLNTSYTNSSNTEQLTNVEPARSKVKVVPAFEEIQDQPDVAPKKEDPAVTENSKPEPIIPEKNNTGEKKNDAPADLAKNNKPAAAHTKTAKGRSFYVGLIVAPDVSMVKFQSVKKTGLNVGVLLGYQLNKKLSIETGVFSDKKYYYSEGKYFNTSKISLQSTAKITMVDGNCKMIEVPLNVKYNFRPAAKLNLFAAAGVSSYFMKQENYNYTITYSSGQPYQRSSTYKNANTQLLCVASVSAGFEQRLNKTMAIRFEPYVKIPVKGIGIGSLPITSTGVNIGITKKLF